MLGIRPFMVIQAKQVKFGDDFADKLAAEMNNADPRGGWEVKPGRTDTCQGTTFLTDYTVRGADGLGGDRPRHRCGSLELRID